MLKFALFKLLKGSLTNISWLVFVVDLVVKLPEAITVFADSANHDVSVIGVAAMLGYLWGIIRRFFPSYKYDV